MTKLAYPGDGGDRPLWGRHSPTSWPYLDGLQENVDALKKLQAETAAELEALLPAVLDRAFKGEL